MRLLLVVPSYYPETYGGAERQATILAEALKRRGVTITLLAPTLRRDTPEEAAVSFGVVHRIRLRDLPARGGRYILSTLAWTARVSRFIRRRRADFDLVYVFHGRLHVAGPLLGARAAGLPIFVKLGGGGASSDYRALHRKRYGYGHVVAALLTRWTTGFIAVSREVEEDLRGFGVEPSRIHRLPNGVELAGRARLESALAGRRGDRFVSVCRLAAEKNVAVLLQALARSPRGELTLVGDGPEEPALRAEAERLGVADRVRFLGALKAVGPELLLHDACVTASVAEGQSNALLEAFAAGVIPVAAAASGVEELIEDGRTGVLAGPPTADAFAAAFARVLALDAAERREISRAAYARAEGTLAIDAVAGRLLPLFEDALQL